MDIKNLPFLLHGSEDSLDKDIYVLCPKPLDHKESLDVISHFESLGFNANPIFIENGNVVWNFKGVNDEVQNSIFHTYSLHEQNIPNPIQNTAERNHGLKALRTIRGLLSQCSRTQYRDIIKPTLKNHNVLDKLKVISQIDFSSIDDYEKLSKVEAGKFFAFQIGQTLGLLQDGEDLFTKKSVSNKYPYLTDLLYRKEGADFSIINKFNNILLNVCLKNFSMENGTAVYENTFNNTREFIDVKKELTLKVEQTNKIKPKF